MVIDSYEHDSAAAAAVEPPGEHPMVTTTHTHPNAGWRSAVSRPRACVQMCSTVTRDVNRVKPSIAIAAFGNEHPTRRGVPPQ